MNLSAPPDEAKRLAVLAESGILDTPAEAQFNDIVALTARLCGTPIAAISLVDANRTWYKAIFGLSLSESPRATALCALAILEPTRLMEIEDTHRDPRFDNFDLGYRFYAGMPIVTRDNFALGTLCVLDAVPRRLDAEQKRALGTLAQAVAGLIEPRRTFSLLGQMKADPRAQQTALGETDEFNRRIVEASRDCIKLLDLEGHLLFMNARGMRQLEICDLEPFIGRQWLDFWKSKDRDAASEAVESARKGNVGRFTGFFPTLSGQPKRWEVVVSPILDAGNQPVRLLAISRDITECKGVEIGLKEADVRLQHVLAVCPAIIYTTQASGDYACTFVSENIQQILGYTQREMLDDPDFWTAHLHPQDARRVLAEVFRLIPRGGGNLEYRFRHRDGHYRWFQDAFKTICDEAGDPLEIVGSWADITERKRGENLLAAQKDILERVAAGTPLTESIDALARFVEHEDGEGRCSILLLNDDGKTIDHVVGPGLPLAYTQAIEGISVGPSMGSWGIAIYRRKPVKVVDIASDPLWENYKDLALAHGLRACFSIPILGAGDQVLGSFAFYYDSPRDISSATWDLMAQVSALAGTAISRSRSERNLQQLANYDLLTELPNRNLFYDRLQRGIARAARDKAKLAIMFVDFDNFKVVNDGLGHHIGDRLLGMIAERLSRCVREEDTVSRWGGDEFTVILERASDPTDVAHTAQRIAEQLSTPFQLDAHEIFITASVGISFFPDDAADLNSLVKHADLAMFQAKAQARGSYRFFSPDLNTRATERLHVEANLRRALERDELIVHYQPQVCLTSRRIAGVEALVRWQHPEWGLLTPARFIPIAEQSGLIVPLGEWVLERACRQMREWERAGCPPMTLAVNLSARQFRQKDVCLMIRQTLERTEFVASRLEVELTESAIMDDVESAARVLAEIRATEVRIVIDDFGKGYSSLAYLKRFPIDKLKIDYDFVRDIISDPDDAAIVSAIITLAHNLDIGVVAEGVETREQLDFLAAQGCDQGQGYYFGKPMPPAQLAELLLQKNGRW